MPTNPTPEERLRFEEQQRRWREAQEELRRQGVLLDLSRFYQEATRGMRTVEPRPEPLFEGQLVVNGEEYPHGSKLRPELLDAWHPRDGAVKNGFLVSPEIEFGELPPPGKYTAWIDKPLPTREKWEGDRSGTLGNMPVDHHVRPGDEKRRVDAQIRPPMAPQEQEFSGLTGWPNAWSWGAATKSPHVSARRNPDGSIDFTPAGGWLPDDYFEGDYEWDRLEMGYRGDISEWDPWPWSNEALTPIIVRKQGRRQD